MASLGDDQFEVVGLADGEALAVPLVAASTCVRGRYGAGTAMARRSGARAASEVEATLADVARACLPKPCRAR